MRYYKEITKAYSNSYTSMSAFAFNEKVRILKFLPSRKMFKDMIETQSTYFEHHNNTRFIVCSRKFRFPGQWVNHFRSVPYKYTWSHDEEQILPDHYKAKCTEFMKKEPEPVHWRPDTRRYWEDEFSGEKLPVINAPVPVVYPEECNKGLWGGEGIIFGYFEHVDKKRRKKEGPRPKVLVPELTQRVVYSEILNRWMSVYMTARAQYLIDEAFGLDNYILQTHEVDLCSRLAMTLKREMLLTLAHKSLYPDNPAKREKICKRYEQFVIPAEEAEYVGLPVHQAVELAQKQAAEKTQVIPLKDKYLVGLVKELKLSAKTA